MASRKIKAVIFDIGRVLIRLDVARATKALASGFTLSPEELWSAIEKDPTWPDWQEGRISARAWHLHLNKRFGGNLTFEQFTDAWNLVLDPEPMQSDELLAKLSGRYRLALLSNTDPIHVDHMETRYNFFTYFPVRVYSCAVGASKPSPIIYREALRGCRVRAEEGVYIDDIAAYVEAAERLGLAGIRYQSPEQLASDLAALGVG